MGLGGGAFGSRLSRELVLSGPLRCADTRSSRVSELRPPGAGGQVPPSVCVLIKPPSTGRSTPPVPKGAALYGGTQGPAVSSSALGPAKASQAARLVNAPSLPPHPLCTGLGAGFLQSMAGHGGEQSSQAGTELVLWMSRYEVAAHPRLGAVLSVSTHSHVCQA